VEPPDRFCIVDVGKMSIQIVEEGSLAFPIQEAQGFGLLHVPMFAEHVNAASSVLGGRAIISHGGGVLTLVDQTLVWKIFTLRVCGERTLSGLVAAPTAPRST
jgi:hypothetical protein